jgi:hypothetical protein
MSDLNMVYLASTGQLLAIVVGGLVNKIDADAKPRLFERMIPL